MNIIFLSQILIISLYFPRKFLDRINYVIKTYPQADYPKLYPNSSENYVLKRYNLQIFNYCILAIGITILSIDLIFDQFNNKQSMLISCLYFFLQMSPFAIMEFSSFSYSKLMRKSDSRATRKASLRPRQLTDFVSIKLFGLAVFMLVTYIAFDLYLYHFYTGRQDKTIQSILIFLAGNVLFVVIAIWNMYGKKLNPYQADKDRMSQVKVTVSSLVYLSIATSIFNILIAAIDQFELRDILPYFTTSFLVIIGFMSLNCTLKTVPIENIDFDVYKTDNADKNQSV